MDMLTDEELKTEHMLRIHWEGSKYIVALCPDARAVKRLRLWLDLGKKADAAIEALFTLKRESENG